MQVLVFNMGDYWVVEVYDEDGQLLTRVGFDHEPTQRRLTAYPSSF
jgi:hypothetical protein